MSLVESPKATTRTEISVKLWVEKLFIKVHCSNFLGTTSDTGASGILSRFFSIFVRSITTAKPHSFIRNINWKDLNLKCRTEILRYKGKPRFHIESIIFILTLKILWNLDVSGKLSPRYLWPSNADSYRFLLIISIELNSKWWHH